MRALIVIAFLFSAFTSWSQGVVGSITDLRTYQRSDTEYTFHASIQPAIRLKIPRMALSYRREKAAYINTRNFFGLSLCPDLAAQYDTSLFYRAAAGVSLEALYRNKFYARANVTAGWSTREGLNQTHTAFLPLHSRNDYIYLDVRARIAYTPNKMLHLSTGIDNQFFGEGARSLIQGDQAAPNPFAMMRVNFWRLEYGLLYQFFNENSLQKRDWKFATTHYLSYNVTRNWNLTLFETVLFQPKDSTFNRAFEVEYLNPIVFFRPQEYSLGSSDNVLLALQSSYTFKESTVYAQLSLDEFVLKEIRARSKWWANKYGSQIGLKGRIGKSFYRVEANIVRPYTYAHINSGQNYGNLGRALGHPLGSNFAELLAEFQSTSKRNLQLKAYGIFQLQGLDEGTISWGGNVYENYLLRPKEYGNTIGQGITVRTVRVGCELGYPVPAVNGKVYIDPQIAYRWGDLPSKATPAITAGFRSDLFQPRRRF